MHNAGVLFMLSTTQHPEEAWRVMEAFIAPETVREFLVVGKRFQPARRSLVGDPLLRQRPFAKEEAGVIYSPIFPYGSPHPIYSHVQELVGRPFQQAIAGLIGIETGLEEAERVLNVELAKWAAKK